MSFFKINLKNKAFEKLRNEGLIALAKSIFRNIKEIFYVINSISKNQKLNKTYSIESLVDFAFSYLQGLIRPKQYKDEILELLKSLNEPKFLLEIGTALGGTLFLFSRIAAKDALIISVDLPGGMYGGGYPKYKILFYKSLVLPNQNIFLIRANSHNEETLRYVKKILNNKKLDFLFIDGDHSYEGVKTDFEMYIQLVKKGGSVAFHDIKNKNFNVRKFWNELKEKYDYFEITKEENQEKMGIGLIKC